MTREELVEQAGEDAVLADGYEDCIIGFVEVNGQTHVVYAREKMLQKLETTGPMSREDAEEFFEYNIAGARIAGQAPAYFTPADPLVD